MEYQYFMKIFKISFVNNNYVINCDEKKITDVFNGFSN